MGLKYPRINSTVSGSTVATAVTADDLEVDSGTLSIDADNNRVGIGTTSPGAKLEVQDTTTGSANTGGAIRLSANDGAPMGDSHRLGVIEFTGAEDSSNTQVVGARIEALTDAAWTNAENGTALYFYTTDGNASQTNVFKLDSNKRASFTGTVGIGDSVPGTPLQITDTAPYVTLKNSTSENTAGGCESKIIFEDHADNALGQIEVSHAGSSDDAKGQLILSTNSNSGLAAAVTIDEAQKVGIGTADPGNILHVAGADAYLTLQNTSAENGEGEAETRVLYADHSGTALAMTEGSHSGTADDTKGKYIVSTHNGSSLTTALTIDDTQTATFGGDVVIGGTTPKLTIGDAGTEDTMLAFDGNAQDYRIGIDDGTDTLEFGVGQTHGTTTALSITSDTSIEIFDSLSINSAIADEKCSGITAVFTAGEALERGEVCYFKAADSKMWKAVATASATSRCVAMAAEDISADATGKFLLYGFLQDNGTFPAYTVGATLFTPEAETGSQNVPEETKPDTDGDFVQVIGWAVTANMVFFNPSNDIIEVA